MNDLMLLRLFSFSSVFLVLTSGVLILILLKYGKSSLHVIWGLFNFSILIWGSGLFFSSITSDYYIALKWLRIGFAGSIFISVFFFHLSTYFYSFKKYYLYIAYGQAAIFLFWDIFAGNSFLPAAHKLFNSFYYPKLISLPSLIATTIWSIWIVLGFYGLLRAYFSASGAKRMQLAYLVVGMLIGWSGGLSYALPFFNRNFFPLGNFTVPIYSILSTYAILRHRLLDIKITFTRAGIFLLIYTLVLGLPFYLGYTTKSWAFSTSMAVLLATLGPLIYRYLQKKTEDLLLAQQKHYQSLLLQAASGMVTIRKLDKLSKLIVYIIKRTVKISFAAIFLYSEQERVYKLKAIRDAGRQPIDVIFASDDPFITHIKEKQEPFLYDELSFEIKDALRLPLDVNLFVPSFVENNLLGFVVLGEKENHTLYSDDDMNVFRILSHQAALAIQNCLFLEEFKNAQEKIFNAEKLASIGGMADGVAHQIKNRLNHFSIASGELQCEIRDFLRDHPDATQQIPDLQKTFDYLIHVSSSLIENVKRTDGIIKGILNYARVGEKETFFSNFSLQEIITLCLDLLRVKHGIVHFPLETNLGDSDTLYGVKAQIMEAIYNLLDNCYEAILDKMTRLETEGQDKNQVVPLITLKLSQTATASLIEITDNGIGIKEEDKHKIFAPFFTTKSSAKSGSGIGMYVVKRMIEENHKGKVTFESTYMQGTKFWVEIPKK